ncbi:MAG: hypothetical protein O7A09_03590 [Proteobacteria bacterium]|nr:hypothetical protein [Pseudomonadota bacterium]MCZ6784539.1 hypothetical protein [Pseudomonadota bacterium]
MDVPPKPPQTDAAGTSVSPSPNPSPMGGEMLPVPTRQPPAKARRTPFWKRIRVRSSVRRAQVLAESASNEAILSRLETVEGQLSALEDALALRFDQMDQRFNRMWEIEDQLDQVLRLREKVESLLAAAQDARDSADAMRRTLRLLAVLTVVAAVLVVLSVSALLP